jgi:hypothetical protein
MGTTVRDKPQRSYEVYKKALKLAIGEGVVFWAINFATSLLPIAAEYRAAFSISYIPMVLVESLLGGMIIACCVSYFLLRFFDKIPTKNSILKSVILSFVALVIIEAPSTFLNLSKSPVYLLIGAMLNVPRFLALGIVIGYLYDRLNGRAGGLNNCKPILGEPDLVILMRNGEIRFSKSSIRKLRFKTSSLHPLEKPTPPRSRPTSRVRPRV